MWEHGPRMESCEGYSECFWENAKKTEQGSYGLNFFKTWNCSWDVLFVPLPGIVDKNEFTSDCLL